MGIYVKIPLRLLAELQTVCLSCDYTKTWKTCRRRIFSVCLLCVSRVFTLEIHVDAFPCQILGLVPA